MTASENEDEEPRSAGTGPSPRGRPAGSSARSESVQSLTRALGVLNRLAEAEGGLSLTRVAERAGLAASTVHRLLTTLEQERYVRFDAEKRLWSVGVQTFLAGRAFLRTRDLVGVARPYMRALMEESRTTVNLAVQHDREAIYVHQVPCPAGPRPPARPGGRVPLHCSAVGKAFLSARSDDALEDLLPAPEARRVTARTIVSRSELRENLAQVRERGFAVDDGEHAVGVRCVAALVFDEGGAPMAAISLSGPEERIPSARVGRLGEMVVRKAAGITERLGGAAPADLRRT